MELFSLFILALTLGLAHAFEADHIAAVSALSAQARDGAKLGFFWGLGHTAILLLAGFIVLYLGLAIPESFSRMVEAVAGVALLLLGLHIIRSVRNDRLHIHAHAHDGEVHAHLHSHKETRKHKHEHRSFFFGVLHGLAGSGALLLLVLPATASALSGLMFILIFGFGSIFGMTLVSFFLTKVLLKMKTWVHVVQYSTATLSVVVGLLMIESSIF